MAGNGNLFVLDTTAKPPCPTRTHEFLQADGTLKAYTFKQGESLELPAAEAAKFLKHPHFIVTDADGKVIKPLPKEAGQGVAAPALGEDEVIARYDELTADALVLRVNALPGGGSAKPAWKKDKLIATLKEARAQAANAEKPRTAKDAGADGAPIDGEEDLTGGEMGDDELDALFGDKAA